jgi:glycine cleavage system H protein
MQFSKGQFESDKREMSGSESYIIPEGYSYTKDHEWIKTTNGSYLVGITDYAVKMLNDIVYVNLPKEGDSLKQKDVFGQVESVKTVSDMYMPVSGSIEKTNNKLAQAPELVTNSPYDQGWMLQIRADKFSEESHELLDAEAYRQFVSNLKDSA